MGANFRITDEPELSTVSAENLYGGANEVGFHLREMVRLAEALVSRDPTLTAAKIRQVLTDAEWALGDFRSELSDAITGKRGNEPVTMVDLWKTALKALPVRRAIPTDAGFSSAWGH